MDDNFFDLGGHSILLARRPTRGCARRSRDDLSVVALLQYPTVRSLARYLSEGETSSAASGGVRDRAEQQRQALARSEASRGRR